MTPAWQVAAIGSSDVYNRVDLQALTFEDLNQFVDLAQG
jgi:hypothetical protein